jgi:hypothetical protein
MSVRQPPIPHPRHWRRIVLAQIVVLILGLFALEILARGYFWLRNEPCDSAETRAEVLHLLDLSRSFLPHQVDSQPAPYETNVHTELTIHPYLGYELDYGCSYVDDEYRRLRSGASAGEFQVVILGGSVAALFGEDELNKHTLRDILAADPRLAQRKLCILDFGRGAYKEPQQLNFVVYLLVLGFKPDAVIDIDGFNEVALGLRNRVQGWHPIYPSFAQWGQLASPSANDRDALDIVGEIRGAQRSLEGLGDLFVAWHLEQSCLAGKLVLHRMYNLRHRAVSQLNLYAKHFSDQDTEVQQAGPALGGDDLEAVKASVESWKESSRSLSDMCRGRGIMHIQFLQPTLLDSGSKPLTASELEHATCDPIWETAVHLGYPLLRTTGEELRRLGVDFVDASMLFEHQPETLYYDCCHFGHEGNVLLAEKIAGELLRRLPGGR